MSRVNVYKYAENEWDETALAGWFNPDSSTKYDEATRWDGNNHVSVNPVDRYGHQGLYRTKGGRWILNTWSQWQGSEDRYEFIDDTTAKDWLLRNEEDDAVTQHFGDLDEESGPNLGGRPAVGPKVEVRLDEETLAKVEVRAQNEGVTRAEMLRRLITAAV